MQLVKLVDKFKEDPGRGKSRSIQKLHETLHRDFGVSAVEGLERCGTNIGELGKDI
jgi:hypothetical protein